MSDSTISTVFSVNAAVGCLMLLLVPLLMKRFSLFRISYVSLFVQLLAFAFMAFAPTGLFIVIIFLRTASCNVLYSSIDSPMLHSMPEQIRGTYAGSRIFSNYIGNSVASILCGQMVDNGNFRLLFIICTGTAAAQLLTYCLLCRPYLKRSTLAICADKS